MTVINFEARLSEAYTHYQRGEFDRAEAIGRDLLAQRPSDPALTGMMGMIAAQTRRFDVAIPFLRQALSSAPENVPLRISLAFALANSGELDEARRIASGTTIPQLERIVAYVDDVQGNIGSAIERYRTVVAGFPEDAESWTSLGRLLTQRGDLGEAIEAYRSALGVRFSADTVQALAQAYARGEWHEERRALMRDAVSKAPEDATLWVHLGVAEAATGQFARAEDAYRKAIELAPTNRWAFLEYGMMLESLNRIDDLAALVKQARERGLEGSEMDFLAGWLAKRQGRFEEALALGQRSGDNVNQSRRQQLIGEAADRLGDGATAYAAFAEMNRIQSIGPAADYARARDLRGQIERAIERLASENPAAWPKDASDGRASPVFLIGFPRSGTTLLDTLLMNLPDTLVLEEEPLIQRLEEIVGERSLGTLDDHEIKSMRDQYWHLVADRHSQIPARIIDKFPLNLVRVPLIHRLFPDAALIFSERHPCDVVLSCFMSRFQINSATVHFHTLEGAARLYDAAMRAWEHASNLMSLKVHRVRYENLIADLPGQLRQVTDFIGAAWDDSFADHQPSADRRAHIPTASYAQVTEPLYSRAAGRWERYRSQMEPVIPILRPWIDGLGYTA